jgi:uncharacterized protein (TIGR00251 family)
MNSTRIQVTVVPKSGSFRIERKADGSLKIHLRSAPESNKANIELLREMRRLLRAEVRIVSGPTSRRKVLEIALSEEEFLSRCSQSMHI